jgi:hypothetical protein
MNTEAYVIAAKAAREAMQSGETDPHALLGIAVDAVVDSGIVPADETGDIDEAKANEAVDSALKALQDLGILPTD